MPSQSDQKGSSRDAIVGRALKIMGIVLIAVAVPWWVFGRFLQDAVPFLLLNLHVPAFLLGLFLLYRGKQYVARSSPADLLLLEDSRPPVVYLRPFKKDASTAARVLPGFVNPAALLSTFSTIEEQLTEALQPIGPLVALARPHTAMPKPGAARFHAADDEWKSLVLDLLGKARLVVLRLGESESIKWEIEKAFEVLSPGQLLFFLHRTKRKTYTAISNSMEQSFGIVLPAYDTVRMRFGGVGAFIAFGDDWKPRSLPLKAPYFRLSTYKPWKRLFNHALEPVFRDLGVDWRPSPISALTLFGIILLTIIVLFFLVLLLSA